MSTTASVSDIQSRRQTTRIILFFDIDNCLYPPSLGIHHLMRERIIQFAKKHRLAATDDELARLCEQYYRDHGLAIRGLLLNHPEVRNDIDAYNEEVDGALPLDRLLEYDEELVKMMQRLNADKIWAFTNAGKIHAYRVLQCLGIAEYFHGVTYCDYTAEEIVCKPALEAFKNAMNQAGVNEMDECWMMDDSAANLASAATLGWKTVHVTPEVDASTTGDFRIKRIHDLVQAVPHLFH